MQFNFNEVVDEAISKANFREAVKFMRAHTNIAIHEPSSVQRLLFKCTDMNLADQIEEIFSILVPSEFIFDSIEYSHCLKPLVNTGRVNVAVKVIKRLLKNKVIVDMDMLQACIDHCLQHDNTDQAIEIIDIILNDPGKNFSSDFLTKIMEAFHKHSKLDHIDMLMNKYCEQGWDTYLQLILVEQKDCNRVLALICKLKATVAVHQIEQLYQKTLNKALTTSQCNKHVKEIATEIKKNKVSFSDTIIEKYLEFVLDYSHQILLDEVLYFKKSVTSAFFSTLMSGCIEKNYEDIVHNLLHLVFAEQLSKVKFNDLDLCKYELKYLVKYLYLKNNDRSLMDSEMNQSSLPDEQKIQGSMKTPTKVLKNSQEASASMNLDTPLIQRDYIIKHEEYQAESAGKNLDNEYEFL